eukprot:CAMPEP_0177742516 /NCGR_PEP_ID=MMETSP0484_2-20121128/28700_1 /TAXON_ID=354590 /ORGANISM="Rhodomonas lens, Strain RHODO" /LENGTH=111 /DNA_ID=CAMNT_0019256849 /DNA_START=52 /DNA_END=388 /DNA_ORIENTATION=-
MCAFMSAPPNFGSIGSHSTTLDAQVLGPCQRRKHMELRKRIGAEEEEVARELQHFNCALRTAQTVGARARQADWRRLAAGKGHKDLVRNARDKARECVGVTRQTGSASQSS